jgi:hypothetical protein
VIDQLSKEKVDDEKTISTQLEQLEKLKRDLHTESSLIQSFKDPEGLTAFRLLLDNFDHNLRFISKEKESQYKNMKNAI